MLALEHENVEQALVDTTAAIASDVVILGCAGFGSECETDGRGDRLRPASRPPCVFATWRYEKGSSIRIDGLPEILAEARCPAAIPSPSRRRRHRQRTAPWPSTALVGAARRCVPGQAANRPTRGSRSGQRRRRGGLPGLLADAEDQIALARSAPLQAPAPQEAPREDIAPVDRRRRLRG